MIETVCGQNMGKKEFHFWLDAPFSPSLPAAPTVEVRIVTQGAL